MSADPDLAKRLRETRKALQLKAKDVASTIAVTRQALSAWEREGRGQSPSSENIRALAKLYGVAESWLRYGDDDFSDFPSEVAPATAAPPKHGRPLPPAKVNICGLYFEAIDSAVHSINAAIPGYNPARAMYYGRALRHLSTFVEITNIWRTKHSRFLDEALQRRRDLLVLSEIIYELLRHRALDWRANAQESTETYNDPPVSLAMNPTNLTKALGLFPDGALQFFGSAELSSTSPPVVLWRDDEGNGMIEINCTPDEASAP